MAQVAAIVPIQRVDQTMMPKDQVSAPAPTEELPTWSIGMGTWERRFTLPGVDPLCPQ